MQFDEINIEDLKCIALKAGEIIMEIYKKDFSVDYKEDKSPLTEADLKSNEFICNELNKLYPNISIMSEENKEIPYEERKDWEYYFCVDPIDGTKEFIKKNDEFTINIALIKNNIPYLGVVYAPALNELYWADGINSYRNNEKLPLFINENPKEKISVVVSKSHLSSETQEFIDKLDSKKIKQISKGSSLKLCMVAVGEADIYPRLAPTMEWDIVAADAIVRCAGKMTYQFELEKPIVYNKEDLLNPWFIVR
ncbi:3'(2'),5'-bisphosphate nucleotidase [Arcobacter suis]|nr:3'(2'),5'-bisphosphate nucleotidase [Arcobacter suis]